VITIGVQVHVVSRYAVEMSKEQDMERFLKRVGKEVEYDG
jgi:hypothetical protein